MTKLVELFAEKNRLPIKEQASYIRRRIPDVLSDEPVKWWRLGDPISDLPSRVLIGIATWTRYDLELVDG
jgi:hypothetical protein